MGILCCKKNQQQLSQLIETEKEIIIPSFSSSNDKEFSKLETTYNLLREINFLDYAMSLVNFSVETATLPDDYSKRPDTYEKSNPELSKPMSSDLVQSFIENKIIKHPNVYSMGENETLISIFKDNMLQIVKSLCLKLQQKDKVKGLEKKEDRVTKLHLLGIGLLYCSGSNVSKIKVIYDIFKEGETLVASDLLADFLLSVFLIPSYCILSSRNKLKYKELGDFSKETMKTILDASELKDSLHLVDVTNKKLFGSDNTGIVYDKFKEMFAIDDGVGYLISPKGVRQALLEHNV